MAQSCKKCEIRAKMQEVQCDSWSSGPQLFAKNLLPGHYIGTLP